MAAQWGRFGFSGASTAFLKSILWSVGAVKTPGDAELRPREGSVLPKLTQQVSDRKYHMVVNSIDPGILGPPKFSSHYLPVM